MSVNRYAALLSVLIQQSYTINEESSEALLFLCLSFLLLQQLLDNAIRQLAKLAQSIILILSVGSIGPL